MKKSMMSFPIFLATFMLLLSSSEHSFGKARSLCKKAEFSIFYCQAQDRDHYISLCGTKNGHIYYRYGKLSGIDMEYPTSDKNPQLAFSYVSDRSAANLHKTTQTKLRFKHVSTTYEIVSNAYNSSKEDEEAVYVNGSTSRALKCNQPSVGELQILSRYF